MSAPDLAPDLPQDLPQDLAPSKNAPSLVPINIGSVLNMTDEDEFTKLTQNTLTQNTRNFLFNTIQVYARRKQFGSSNNDDKTQNQNHVLLILTSAPPYFTASQYLFDRPKSLRFVKVTVDKDELMSAGLILIKEYTTIKVSYTKDIQPFLIKESKKQYDSTNNNLHFIYNFIDKILLKSNEWNHDFDTFSKFVKSHFKKKKKNKKSKLNCNCELEYQKYIQLLDPESAQLSWIKNDKLLVNSKDCTAQYRWYIGSILKIDQQNDNKFDDYLNIEYKKLGNRFSVRLLRDSNWIKPFIQIPSRFLDPITKRLMTDPVQILKSGMVYDAVTVKYLQEFYQNNAHLDPITGVLISIPKKKPIVVKKYKLRKEIDQFCNKYYINNDLYNNFTYVNDDDLWKQIWKDLQNKYDVKQQQKKIFGKSVTMFYPENASQVVDDDNGSDDTSSEYILRWDPDNMFINQTSIPIVTCMGPSRIGKSYLLSAMLRNQVSWKKRKNLKKKEVFKVSKSPNERLTKGSWISLYGDIDNGSDNKNDTDGWVKIFQNKDVILIDQCDEDDTDLWTIYDVQSWFISLNPKFSKLYPEIMQYIKQNEINGKTLHTLNDKSLLINEIGLKEKYANLLVDVLDKRLRGKIDEIDTKDIKQMYLIDMEGLSHGITSFTKKLFEGCYAISNVVMWYDERVASDAFKMLMKQLKDNMKVIANSSRKPAFIYVLRDGPNYDFNFDFFVDDDRAKGTGNDGDDKNQSISNSDHSDTSDDDRKYDPNDFNVYINNHKAFREFRNMNIFSSIHGYKLELRKRSKKKGKYYDTATLNRLVDKIKEVSYKTARFVNNTFLLNDQINNINRDSQLSYEKRCALCNSKLKWFIFSQIDKKKSELQVKNAIITFDYNVLLVKSQFNQGYKSLEKQLQISQQFDQELQQNKIKIINEIQKILEERKNAVQQSSARTKVFAAIGIAAGLAAVGALAVGTCSVPVPAALAFSAVSADDVGAAAVEIMAACGRAAYYYFDWRPPKLPRTITETDLSELELF